MHWLLDANLPYRLVKQLEDVVVEVTHVSRTGLPVPATDRQIWEWARQRNAVVVTNDEDFHRLAAVFGFPPNVVLLRMGNQSNLALANILKRHLRDIEELVASDEQGLLELF